MQNVVCFYRHHVGNCNCVQISRNTLQKAKYLPTFTLMARWSSMNDFQKVNKKLDEILDALTGKVDDDSVNKKTNKLDEILDALTDKVDDDSVNKKTNKLDEILDALTYEEEVNSVKKKTNITTILIEIKNILASKK